VTRVDVQSDVDLNGILIVTATEVGNSNTGSIRNDNISGRLCKDTIDKMILDAEKYRKIDDERVLCAANEKCYQIKFDLDVNDILTVIATEVGNSNTGSIRIDNISGRLSKDTIDKMILDAEKY
jgi:molecular chaperone DnaK (HSP70)